MGEQKICDRGAVWLATGVGLGLATPVAPGTIGGLWGLPLAWGLSHFDPHVEKTVAIVLVFAAMPICAIAARALGGQKDPGAIALDEIVALPLAYWNIAPRNLAVWIAGFMLFRVFDILKPFPVRQVERLPGGVGIVADDVMAAIYACLALHGLLWLDGVLQLSWLIPAT